MLLHLYYSKPKSSTNVLLMKISLFQRKLKDGKVSLFIEYYRGSEVSKDGKRRYLREYENLKLYLHSNPNSKEEKNKIKKPYNLLKTS